jgi:serine phosphatase RsbU (regulator of sigma subunit)
MKKRSEFTVDQRSRLLHFFRVRFSVLIVVAVCCCSVLQPDQLFAQKTRIDSLRSVLQSSKPDTHQVTVLNDLCKEAGFKSGNYDTALYYADRAKKLALQLNYKSGVALSCLNVGTAHLGLAGYLNATENFAQARDTALVTKDTVNLAKAYAGLGNSFSEQGNYPEATVNYLSALKLAEMIKDPGLTGRLYNNLGLTYQKQGSYDDALKNYEASLRIKVQQGDKQGMSKAYNNIGLLHTEKENFPEALRYYNMSLQLKRELNDQVGIGMSYNNIGDVQFAQGQYDSALNNFQLAYEIREKAGDKRGVAASKGNIAKTYLVLHQPALAKIWVTESLEAGRLLGNKEIIRNSYFTLSQVDSALGDFSSGYRNYKQYILYRDSMVNEANTKKTVQAQMQYEYDKQEAVLVEKQEKERLVAEEKNRKQKLISYFVGAGLLLAIIFALFILRSLSTTRKQKKMIELKEEETRIQKHVIEEKHREITDSINYAERIQRSFLATDNILTESLKDYFVLFQPKDVVSGDFYWASNLRNGNFGVMCADSTGHGVPGAIMSILNISSLELAVKEQIDQPAEILNYTRNAIISRLRNDGSAEGGKDGMDGALVVINESRTKLTYAAANNPVWIIRSGEIIELKPDKMPVGKHLNDHIAFSQAELELFKGDMIYLLTDGLPDQFGGPKGKKYKYGQLKEKLLSICSLEMHEQMELLLKDFSEWKGDLEQIDDVTLMGIRV